MVTGITLAIFLKLMFVSEIVENDQGVVICFEGKHEGSLFKSSKDYESLLSTAKEGLAQHTPVVVSMDKSGNIVALRYPKEGSVKYIGDEDSEQLQVDFGGYASIFHLAKNTPDYEKILKLLKQSLHEHEKNPYSLWLATDIHRDRSASLNAITTWITDAVPMIRRKKEEKSKIAFIADVLEKSNSSRIRIEGEEYADLESGDREVADGIVARAKESFRRRCPVSVGKDQSGKITSLYFVDCDYVKSIKEGTENKLEIEFRGHLTYPYFLAKDHPDYKKIYDLLQNALAKKSRVWIDIGDGSMISDIFSTNIMYKNDDQH
jgi:hypothetical protein